MIYPKLSQIFNFEWKTNINQIEQQKAIFNKHFFISHWKKKYS